ncbi:MAG: metalloregulator ArsR/SmtB family transcription factor [Candidatus Lokiarchaeota archaeon]|nr:metalloregulator ArsR/SmtB family transcription factor [Candidatus Lokiarchaeota archaeon]
MVKLFEYMLNHLNISLKRRKTMKPINLIESDIEKLSKVFQTLSDPLRLCIIEILTQGENITVSEIAERVNLSISSVGHQLNKLKDRGFVGAKKIGRKAIHRIEDDCIHAILRSTK